MIRWVALGSLWTLVACIGPPAPVSQQIATFQQAEACIQSHWGESIALLAGDCLSGEVAAAEDIVADIEAIAEGTIVLKGGNPSSARAAFPYQDPKIIALVEVRRSTFAAKVKSP